jgi:hypothetical protein
MVKNKNVPRLVLALVLLLLLSTMQVQKASAFDSKWHETITKEVLLKKLGFSEYATEKVTEANLNQDSIAGYGILPGTSNTEVPDYHGDRLAGETSLQAFNRLRNFISKTKGWVKNNLTKCDVEKAWIALGQALHALQDFYSHSNFADDKDGKDVFTKEEKAEIKKALEDPSYNPEALKKLKMTGWGIGWMEDPERYRHEEENKDSPECPSGSNAFRRARSAAENHTETFLRRLKEELKEEDWYKLIGKQPPAKPSPSVKERTIKESTWKPGGIWEKMEFTPPDGFFEISIHYSSSWTMSLTVLEGLPNGVILLSSNPEPSLIYTATIGSPDNPPVTLVLWNFTSMEGPIGLVEIEYSIVVTEEAIKNPSVARRCEHPIPGYVLLYGEVLEIDANGTRYKSIIGGQQSILFESEPVIDEEHEDATHDLIGVYTGQAAPLESYVPYSDVKNAAVSVYPQWLKFILRLVDRIPERPESFTSFTVGVDRDGDSLNNCPDMPFDGVDTIYSVLYDLDNGFWRLEKSSYEGFWTMPINTGAVFQISEERDTLVLWIPRGEPPGLRQALRWKVVTEANLVGDKALNEGAYSTPVSIYSLTVKTLPRTLVKIGGVNYTADPAGEVRKYVKAGEISIEVEPLVSVFEDTRKIFSRWSDGSSFNPRLITVDRNITLTAEFATEYLLTVSSDYGDLAQSSWFREESIVNISAPTVVNISAGSRVLFNGWAGDVVSSDPIISLKVDYPLSIEATWRTQHLLSLSFRDKAGRSISPSWVKLSGPRGVLNLTSYEAWVDEGEWKIEKVWYKGVDVCPVLDASYYVSKPLAIDVPCEVYDAKLVLKDAAGNPVSNAVVEWEITFPDGTIQAETAETSGNGTLIISSVPKGEHEIKFSYRGQEVKVSIDASTGIVEEVSLPVEEAFPMSVPLILITVSAILSLAVLTYLLLYWMCFITSAGLKKAEKEAEEKAKKLSEAEKRLAEAKRGREEAKTRLNNASRRVKEASRMLEEARKQEEPKSWVETVEEGKRRRITDIDLRLKNKEAKNAWERYVRGEISAEECMREWERLGEPDALEKLREREKRLKEEEIRQAERSLEEAREEERRAMEELKQAEQQEEKAKEELEKLRTELKEAEEEAGRLREKLDKCRRKPPPPPPPPPPEAPRKLEKLVPPPKPPEKLPEALPPPELKPKMPPPPPPELPPQYLNGRQLKLGMEHELHFKGRVQEYYLEKLKSESYRGCPDACWKALQVILAEEWLAILRELGFTAIITPISVAITPATTLGTVAKKAVIHLLGLAKVGNLFEYIPEGLLSELFGIIFPGWLSDFADTTVGAAGGIKGLEEYLAGQHIQYVEVKQTTTLLPSKYTTYECKCKVDGGIFYNPHTRYVVGVFKCLCGKGPPKLLTIKYKANKDGYSDGPVESDEWELPEGTPVDC